VHSAFVDAANKVNLRKAGGCEPIHRWQVMCDGLSFTAHEGCSRFGGRCMDLYADANSQLYFRSVSFHIGGDGYLHCEQYLKAPLDQLNAGVVINESLESAIVLSVLRPGEPTPIRVTIRDGGDMSAACAWGALDSPVARYGCCYYCELGKEQWVDEAACKAAKRRKLWRQLCAAHEHPYTVLSIPQPATAPTNCPLCPFVCTDRNVAGEKAHVASMKPSAKKVYLRKAVKSHKGYVRHRKKLLYTEDKHRHLTALPG